MLYRSDINDIHVADTRWTVDGGIKNEFNSTGEKKTRAPYLHTGINKKVYIVLKNVQGLVRLGVPEAHTVLINPML